MTFKGKIRDLNIHNTFAMKNTIGDTYFLVERNNYIGHKVFIRNPINNTEYIGELFHAKEDNEFLLYKDNSEMLVITEKTVLGIPKFNIKCAFNNYSARFSLSEMSLQVFEDNKKILNFTGNKQDYLLEVENDCNIFCAMALAYGITLLLNEEGM